MKGAATVVLIASYLVCQIESLGICYDPKHVDQVTPDVIKKDMKQLKDMGYTAIRTYSTGDNMGQIAMEAGLDVALGIRYPGADAQADVETAIKLATGGLGPGKVKTIFVGNENFANTKEVKQDMLDLIKSIKAKAPGVKVGTSQRQADFLDTAQAVNNMAALVEAVDVIGVNIHPLFAGSRDGRAGMESLKAQWQALKGLDGKYPGLSKKLALTEVGWPSGGKDNASPQIATDFYKGYMEWSDTVPEDQYYFKAYDQPGRGKNGEGEYEKFFGIMDKDGKPKYPDVKVAGGGSKKPNNNTAIATSGPPVTPVPVVTQSPKQANDAFVAGDNDDDCEGFFIAGDSDDVVQAGLPASKPSEIPQPPSTPPPATTLPAGPPPTTPPPTTTQPTAPPTTPPPATTQPTAPPTTQPPATTQPTAPPSTQPTATTQPPNPKTAPPPATTQPAGPTTTSPPQPTSTPSGTTPPAPTSNTNGGGNPNTPKATTVPPATNAVTASKPDPTKPMNANVRQNSG